MRRSVAETIFSMLTAEVPRRGTRVAGTKQMILQSLLHHLSGNHIKDVSVASVVDRAGVSRATFYNHYRTLEDVLLEAFENVNRQCCHCLGQGRVVDMKKSIQFYLETWQTNSELFLALDAAGFGRLLFSKIHAYVESLSATLPAFAGGMNAEQVACLDIIAAGIHGVLESWLNCDIAADSENVSDRVELFFLRLLHYNSLGAPRAF